MTLVPTEHDEQRAVINWAVNYAALRWSHLCLPDKRFPLAAIPNGGDRHVAVAARLKAEGVSAGMPDLFLAVPTVHASVSRPGMHGYCGMFVEMKRRKGGRVSAVQSAWHEYLARQGYRVVVARGSDEAIEAITDYLEGA